MIRTYVNLLIIFFVTGLWHGASFNFIVWGLFHGVFLVLERWRFGTLLEKLPKAVRHIYTMLVVMIGWVFFRADTLSDAVHYIRNMFDVTSWNGNVILSNIGPETIVVLLLGTIFATPVMSVIKDKIEHMTKGKSLCNSIYLGIITLVFILSVCYMTGSGFNPFIYFRF